jgi:hypothetical protein
VADDDLTEHQIELLRALNRAGGILIVRDLSELPDYVQLEKLGHATAQSADFGDVRFRITRKGTELLRRDE